MKSLDGPLRCFKLATLGVFTGATIIASSGVSGIVDCRYHHQSRNNISQEYLYGVKTGAYISLASVLTLAGTMAYTAIAGRKKDSN